MLADLAERARTARDQAQEYVAQLALPTLPSLDELRARAEALGARTPSMVELVTRARELLAECVSALVLQMELPATA